MPQRGSSPAGDSWRKPRHSSRDSAQHLGTSLLVPWLRLFSPNAGGPDLIPTEGTRALMLQVRPGADQKSLKMYIYIYAALKCKKKM